MANVYNDETWTKLVVDESGFRMNLVKHFEQLVAAYDGMVLDASELEQIVRAAVDNAIMVHLDPHNTGTSVPSFSELAVIRFEGGCATCAFCEKDTSILSELMGRKPPMLPNVVSVAGVNIRAFLADGVLAVVVGYLDHTNIFEIVFHNDLVARLQLLLTPQLIRSVIEGNLIAGELTRRMIYQSQLVMMEAYGYSPRAVIALADAKEHEKAMDPSQTN